MLFKIYPLDTLFFRDSRPFSKGVDSWANGIFPPAPSVFYGALRSAHFSHHIDELDKANEDGDPTKNLKIKGIFFRVGESDYLPLPYDLVKKKKSSKKEVFPLIHKDISDYFHSGKTSHILTTDEDITEAVETVKSGLIENGDLNSYLKNEYNGSKKYNYHELSEFVSNEPKIGIARNNYSHSTEEGMLYRVGMNRLDNFSFVIDFNGLGLPHKGFIKIGGEGKGASYELIDDLMEIQKPDFADTDKFFKLYISTPAIFNNGWIPDWINPEKLEGIVPDTNCRVRLLTAALSKPLHLGGFDIKKRQPKPMKKAVGNGSVYYFEVIEGNIKKIVDEIHGKSISDEEMNKKQGFGISFIGRIKF
ncbi:MAG: type III-B CRISPR module-associated protein Cmr3 [bacterium]